MEIQTDMDTLDQREVELGRVKFWYNLNNESLLKLAEACPAKVDRQQIFKGFPQEMYSTEAAQRYLEEVICEHGNKAVVKIVPDNCLLQWAASYKDIDNSCAEFDSMVIAMRNINPYSLPRFNLYELGNPYRASSLQTLLIHDEAIFQKIFYTCVLETSTIELRRAVLYLRCNKYDPPSRQIYDRNPLPDVAYVAFIKWLGEQHATKNKKGGSYPDTERRKATIEMCETVVDAHMDTFKKKDLGLGDFKALVKSAMTAQEKHEHFHPSAAMEFFRQCEKLAPYRRGRGAPHKSK